MDDTLIWLGAITGVVFGVIMMQGIPLMNGQHLYDEKALGSDICTEHGLSFDHAEYASGNKVTFICKKNVTEQRLNNYMRILSSP